MHEILIGWRRKVAGVILLIFAGCSAQADPNQKLVDNYLADTDLRFHIVKRYGTAASDDQLAKHLATKAVEATHPADRERILRIQSSLPFTATRAIFRMEGRDTDDDALFIIRNGAIVVDVYYLRPNDHDGQLFAEFVERAFR